MKISGILNNEKPKRYLSKVISISIWLLLWQTACMVVNKDILLVSPVQTVLRLFELASEAKFWITTALSMFRILLGYAAGVVVGTAIAMITSFIKPLYSFFSPAIGVIKATPVASFIILALVWFKRDTVPVFASFLMVLPIIWANVSQGISETDSELLEMSRVFKFSRVKRLTSIYIPSTLPYFSAGCTTALGLSWKAGIAAEVLCVPSLSIGKQLYNSKIYIETADLFAWTVVVIIMSMLLEYVFKGIISGRFRGKGGRRKCQ